MHGWSLFETAVDLLRSEGEAACLALLRSIPVARRRGEVELIVGTFTIEEALEYAGVLFDLGQGDEGEEVVREVIAAELGSDLPILSMGFATELAA